MVAVNDDIFSDLEIEKAARVQFGRRLEVERVIVRDIPVSASLRATLFLTSKNALYLYIAGEAPLILADAQKYVRRMGLEAREYMPPAGSPDYFEFVGRQEFHKVFPSRKAINDSDLVYYRTLAPYSPALVRIARIKDGDIHGYDLDSHDWRRVAEYSYAMLKTKAD